MNRFAAFALVLGCVILAGIAVWSGLAEAGRDVLRAAWVLPGMIGVHLLQLFLSALSWRSLLGIDRITVLAAWRLRWMREGIDSLLPVAQVGGELVSIQLLARGGMRVAEAGAATTLDLITEAATLAPVVLAGSLVFLAAGGDPGALRWVWAGAGLVVIGVGGFAAAQRVGLLRVAERLWARMAPPSWRFDGLQAALNELVRDRARMSAAVGWHLAAWSLGAVEVWAALQAIGCPLGLDEAFVIEAFGMAARGLGFAIPASLGVQEGGYVLAAGLFGFPADAALALAALKRLREVLVGIAGLWLWRLEDRRVRQVSGGP